MSDERGTNRDYDESQTSKNQGHGHPRGKRGQSGHAGESDRVARDRIRGDDKVGGRVKRKKEDSD